jgi:hypothetical protein
MVRPRDGAVQPLSALTHSSPAAADPEVDQSDVIETVRRHSGVS